MNYSEIGERVIKLRKEVLKLSREKFAELVGFSCDTIKRVETGNLKKHVKNVEVYLRIAQVSGYTLEELLLGTNSQNTRNKTKRKIEYLLNVMSDDELEFVDSEIEMFMRFRHKEKVNTLKDIKKKINEKKKDKITC